MAAPKTKPVLPPAVPRPGDLNSRGVTIPVPTPTGRIPNPWKPQPDRSDSAGSGQDGESASYGSE